VSSALAETVFDPFAPLGRIGGDGAGNIVNVKNGKNVDGVFDVFEPLGVVFPALAYDQFVEAVISWVGKVYGNAPFFDFNGIIEEHVEEPQRNGAKSQLFDANGLIVPSSGFWS